MASTRITQGMINTQLVRNLTSNLNRLNSYQEQLTTQRRINRPSDDPVGMSYALRYRSELKANSQYEENASNALSWLDNTESALNSVNSILQRVRELAVQGANGTNSDSSLDSIKEEVSQLKGELVEVANTQFNGKYIFNGQKTNLPPYDASLPEASVTDTGAIQYEIGVGTRLTINMSGEHVFGPAESNGSSGNNMFSVLDELYTALDNGNSTAAGQILDKLDSQIDNFLGVRAEIGAKMNRLELTQNRLADVSVNLQTLQSKVEDVDAAEAMTNLKTSENVYQAALSIGAQIIKPSLVDFLK